ncbi:pyridoxamine 5'-phosphate oxidase-related FMN-binding protein [Methanosalsum zhilinae DSM 4017]|uniref:Pyridoxamine 5'-phosphate oxidase-related FMN-binding protein n=1 Tax=Methanosalsum zhilinae (strain DSM 4017 / NBRC 107636 / OCM 62 / WeN5) TaxID=679901 RepID=F7XM55_METZD|nr:pyridoxamine 5'-phosphate oxidase family protein [Methanosalsum zhilinae]AEH61462.1 pyridoxamine 5'-phosphate oxidase-related FMN-binding protein [Methanosalsum zhilinae DSM 4017]
MNYDPKKTHLISRIREVLESQSLAGLATSSSDIPYLSLVAFAVTDDLRYILFSTDTNTRKYSNISKNPSISFLIDSRKNADSDLSSAVAITATGHVEWINEQEMDRFKGIFLGKHPQLRDFVDSNTTVLLRADIDKYIVVSNFSKVSELAMSD